MDMSLYIILYMTLGAPVPVGILVEIAYIIGLYTEVLLFSGMRVATPLRV